MNKESVQKRFYPPLTSEITSTDLVLVSDGLLSKWGFCDGDDVYDWANDMDWEIDKYQETLVALVKEHLLPCLDQNVEVEEIVTAHNPIRAKSVGGQKVNWYEHNPRIQLTPKEIRIPMGVVLDTARRFGAVEKWVEDSPEDDKVLGL